MFPLSEARLAELLAPYVNACPVQPRDLESVYVGLSKYLALLLRWNQRTNLTAIREPEAIVKRHFGESLFAGCVLAEPLKAGSEILDLGSGAGFPGLPIQLLLPQVRVTLAESQGKKVAFLREAVRTLKLTTEVWDGRVESMGAERRFDAVTLRAVDRIDDMTRVGIGRLLPGGVLLRLTTEPAEDAETSPIPGSGGSFVELRRFP